MDQKTGIRRYAESSGKKEGRLDIFCDDIGDCPHGGKQQRGGEKSPEKVYHLSISASIKDKNRLQNTHTMAFKNNHTFLFFELEHIWPNILNSGPNLGKIISA